MNNQELINIHGYKNNSPFKNAKKLLIESNNITMENVDIPLLLRPNKGMSKIAMPNSGQYTFPKAKFVTEIPLANYQSGGFNDCPEGYIKDETGQCIENNGFNPIQYQNKGIPAAPISNYIGNNNVSLQDNNTFTNENQSMKLKRIFGTPNIPAILATNLLGFGLSTFANKVEQGRQTAFMQKQMNNPTFNGTYSNAQNDYGVDPYEQTGQLRSQYQKGGLTPIYTSNPKDPSLKAYNDSLKVYNASRLNAMEDNTDLSKILPINSADKKRFTDKETKFEPIGWYPNKNLDELNSYWSAFKKPVQPIIYKKPIEEPLDNVKGTINNLQRINTDLPLSGQPIPYAPNIQQVNYDFTKPTNYSITNQKPGYLNQSTTFYPTESMWLEASKNAKTRQSGKGYGTAAIFQKGGSFNPISYLYGDDEDTIDAPNKETIEKIKQKRITEKDIDNNDELANDVLNMDSITVNKKNSYTAQNTSDYALMYLKHQQGATGASLIQKAAEQGLDAVPRSWNRENIQANMKNNIGKDFKGKLTPASFIDYWSNKFNNHMQIVADKKTPYDSIFQKIGQEEGIDPLFLKAVANIESGLNAKNNTGSKYKGLFAMNSSTFKGNIFDPVQNTKAAVKNFKQYEQGGTFSVDFDTMAQLQAKGINFKIID